MPTARLRTAHPARWPVVGAWLLLSAVLLVQQLGWQHRYAHGAGWAHPTTAQAQRAEAPGQSVALGLPEHSDDACALLDHLCLGDAHAAPTLALPTAAALVSQPPALAADLVASHSLPPQARGPPHRV